MKEKAASDRLLYEGGQKKYEFYAFISYKSGDIKWAKWVQRRLELYRLPVELLQENEALPPSVSPVCWDNTDLTGGKTVEGALSDKVSKSKYLIVICSRRMQQDTTYIDLEVEAFLAAGNPVHRIIPFIVDGVPNSADPKLECLPPSIIKLVRELGSKIPVWIQLDRRHPREATLTLVASILELERKALKSHDQAHRQRQAIIGLILGTAFLAGLISFVLWQLFNVKEAQLHEQLTYAEDTFRQGDRLSAQQMAQEAENDCRWPIDEEIRESAATLSRLADIHPKYQPLTRLCEDTDGSRALFTADGEHVLIITESLVRKYDMSGNCVMSFEPPEGAHRIVDVSADGVHAVVMTAFVSGYESELWLWNMETDEGLAYLVGSGNFSVEDSKEGNFSNVVNARFSPDGSIVCAYRDGAGYFNECEELTAWDSESGAKLFSFPGELLGAGNQSYEVEAFSFIGNDTLYWNGTKNHVFYTLGEDEPVVVSRRDMPDIRNKGLYTFSDARVYIDRYSGLVKNVVTGQSLQLDFDEAAFLTEDCTEKYFAPFEVDGRYAIICCYLVGGSSSRLCDVKLLDLQSMDAQPGAESFARVCRGRDLSFKAVAEGSCNVYAYVSGLGLFRFDCASGETLHIDIPNAEGYDYIGRYNGIDILAAGGDGYLSIVELSEARCVSYSLDTDQSAFLASAALATESVNPQLLAKHKGSYYLFPLSNPGIPLDEGGSLQTKYAVGADGQLIVKAEGAAFKVWQDGQLLMTKELGDNILELGADKAGRFFVLTGNQLELYNEKGLPGGSIYPGEGRKFISANLSAEGGRMAVLSGQKGPFADNVYELALYDSGSLEEISMVSDMVHVAPGGQAEIAYDLSPGGKWLGAVVRITERVGEQYQLSVLVWNTADGSLAAQTQNINQMDAPVFELLNMSVEAVSSAARMRYVTFPSDSVMLCGLQYGTWVMDLENMQTRAFISESYACDALPDMLTDGRLIYPSDGVHLWSIGQEANRLEAVLYHPKEDNEGIALFKAENLGRLNISEDKQWLTVRGEQNTWLYSTRDWEHSSIAASQPVQVLYIDDVSFIYVTPEGLLYYKK